MLATNDFSLASSMVVLQLEYESYIRKMQESISNVMAKLQNMVQATEVETLRYL